MKLLIIDRLYQSYIDDFYSRNSDLEHKSFITQQQALENDGFAWVGVWNEPFERLGFKVKNIYSNIAPIQNAWAKENGIDILDLDLILEKQINEYQPDIIFTSDIFNYNNEWIINIKNRFPSVKIIMGYVCSPSYVVAEITAYDYIFTCLESIRKQLIAFNIKSYFLPHAFNSSILTHLQNKKPEREICFYGGFVRGSKGHGYRENILIDILKSGIKIDIFSDAAKVSPLKDLISIKSKKILFRTYRFLKYLQLPKFLLNKLPYFTQVLDWSDFKADGFNKELRKVMNNAKFGLPLYQTMLNYNSVLNIHGDLAKEEAANMRMFEVTGVGKLLITDWKPNLHLFFEDGKEVLSFKNSAECIEKIKWAKSNPREAAEIARAGQLRTLNEHTFEKRAQTIFEHIFN